MHTHSRLYIQKHLYKLSFRGFLTLCLIGTLSVCRADERSTAKRFESAKADEPSLIAFLKTMPKGGDLHVHVGGATYMDVKTLARCSLANSFLSGDSLFVDANCQKLRPEFAGVTRPGWNPSIETQHLLDQSEKMRVQLRLEQALTAFENE